MSTRVEAFQKLYGAPLRVTTLLYVMGLADLLFTVIGLVFVLAWRIGAGEPVTALFAGLLLVGFLLGLTMGGVLLALASAWKYGYILSGSLAEPTDIVPGAEDPIPLCGDLCTASPGTAIDGGAYAQGVQDAHPSSVGLDATLNITYLPPEEQAAAYDRIRANQQRRAAEAVIDAINARRLGVARVLLEDAQAILGDSDRFDRLQERIEMAAARFEPLDFARTRRAVQGAIRDGRWASAESCVRALFRDHPESQRCKLLWEDTRRARLYAQIEESIASHNWDEALSAAEEFRMRFPESFEAETLAAQMETLKHNAETLRRRQYEQRFQELVASKHFAEALRLAKYVVEQYPESPQASVLRKHVPLLQSRLSHATA